MQTLAKPSPDTAESARSALRALQALAPHLTQSHTMTFRAQDHEEASLSLPPDLLNLLLELLGQIANGCGVSIIPIHSELTTSQAANLLGVSRPFVITLIERGELPCRKVGSHRRIRLPDLLEYKQRDDQQRHSVLDELTAEAQELGLGY